MLSWIEKLDDENLDENETFESKVGDGLSLTPGTAPDVRHSSSSPSPPSPKLLHTCSLIHILVWKILAHYQYGQEYTFSAAGAAAEKV